MLVIAAAGITKDIAIVAINNILKFLFKCGNFLSCGASIFFQLLPYPQ
jgi:hypothetical protein